MYGCILVPTDGSPAAQTAGDAAISLAQAVDADLHVVSVHERERWPFELTGERVEPLGTRGAQAARAIAEQAREAGVDATTTVLEDSVVHRAIIEYANTHSVDCIAMGTHGRTGVGRLVLGSVAEQTLRESPVPVLAVHEETELDSLLDPILVPTDGSEAAMAALDQAIELATITDSSLQLVSVVDVGIVAADVDTGVVYDILETAGKRALDIGVTRARKRGVSTVEATLLRGRPSQAICEYAEKRAVGCIVMGKHGPINVPQLFLGSVAERVVRHSKTPVIVTKGVADAGPVDVHSMGYRERIV